MPLSSPCRPLLCAVLIAASGSTQAAVYSSNFSGNVGEAWHSFSLSADSEVNLYVALSNGATCGNSGFSILSADHQTTVVRSGFAPCSASEKRGPWALQAGSYTLQLWHNGGGGSVQAQLNNSTSSYGNDSEPNDTPATAQPLAADGGRVSGHLGYGNGNSIDAGDYYRLSIPANGALSVTFNTDSSMPAGARGYVLYASDGSSVVRDLSQLSPGTYYLGLYVDTYYAQAYGGYSLATRFKAAASASSGVLSTSVSNVDFAHQEVGSSSTRTITLSNSGNGPASISGIVVSGNFSLTHNCPASLAAGSQCAIDVSFKPSSTGIQSGVLSIQTDLTLPSLMLTGTGMVTSTGSSWTITNLNPIDNNRAANFNLMFKPKSSDSSSPLKLYVAGLYAGQVYFLSLVNWNLQVLPYFGGTFPVYASSDGASLPTQTWYVALGDVSSLSGLEIYAGFGKSDEDMMSTGQLKLIHRVP